MQGILSIEQKLVKTISLSALIISASVFIGFPVTAAAGDTTSPPVKEPTIGRALPDILSNADSQNYQRIFALQKNGQWRRADKLIRQLEDPLLMGHVQAQRYLHPTKYRSRYTELAKWLKTYADHPDARRIYRLAVKRKPRNYRAPRRPESRFYPSYQPTEIIENSGYRPHRRSAKRIIRQVRRMTHQRRLTAATRYIDGKTVRRILGKAGLDLARTLIASGWFFYGNSNKAYQLASLVAARSGELIPYSHWIAGLASYRLGKFLDAANHFEAVALSPKVKGYDHAAAAFWAARANMTGQKPARVGRWLETAAEQPRTFYGIIARRWLGEQSPLNWSPTVLTEARLERILDLPSGRRAVALIQLRQTARAGRELRFMANANDPDLTLSLIAVAESKSLPMVAYRAGAALIGSKSPPPAGALYPLPNWQPREGFRVDRALVFAFIRQESAFNVRAKSSAGARGLMQLMPATAGFIARKRFRGRKRNQLYDPALNISLGQKYIQHLLENDHIDGDLLLVAAAYNGGPGNLRKWQRRARKGAYTDALMFIESIPARETRIFIERVLSNLWMYRERLGEPAPSLDALAAGERPVYIAVDGSEGSVAEDVRY
ncbi:MAG: Soluble lytic murein transglycosylase [Alphaproteobacteria bacterium MarineAlpha11_Bin1]|nr:MAG: Soluble lytic murein transglycosylase [Alphaproteobacteria bacterium MarineAlpha11_Bin1]